MRLYLVLVLILSTVCSFAQPNTDFFGPFPPTRGNFIPPNGQPCLNQGIHTAMPFMGFGHSCFEHSLNQIRVVAPLRDGLVNSDQNPALLVRPMKYQAAQIEVAPWQTNNGLNPYASAFKVSLQKQFRRGGGWSMRYENFNLHPILTPSSSFFSDVPILGSLFRLAYAKPLSEHWSMGLAVKHARKSVGNNAFFFPLEDRTAWAADLGFRYQNSKELSVSQKLNWQWGFSLANLGPRVGSESAEGGKQYLPSALSLGFLLEEEFLLKGASLLRIRGSYQFNKLLVPNPCPACDIDANGIPDTPTHSAIKGLFSSLADSPDGLRGELREINHQFDMSVLHQFSSRFALHSKASLFYQHPEQGGAQYFATQLGFRWGKIHLDMMYWRPNNTQITIADRQFSLSLAYQHFFPTS